MRVAHMSRREFHVETGEVAAEKHLVEGSG